jgi:hypothetical protein
MEIGIGKVAAGVETLMRGCNELRIFKIIILEK